MMLCTAANADFRQAWKVVHAFAGLYKWREITFDLGGLGSGKELSLGKQESTYPMMGWRYKPLALLETLTQMDESDQEEGIYLDCDAFPIMSPASVFRFDFDLALAVRNPWDLANKSPDDIRFMGCCNAGVVFFRPTAKAFFERWAAESVLEPTDQHALNNLVFSANGGRFPLPSSTLQVEGCRVLFLPDPIYNYRGDFSVRSPFCRIAHLNGGRWKNHLDTLRVLSGLDEPPEYRR